MHSFDFEMLLTYLIFGVVQFFKEMIMSVIFVSKMILISVTYIVRNVCRLMYLLFYYIPKKLYSFKKYLTPFMKRSIFTPLVDLVHSITSDLQCVFSKKYYRQVCSNIIQITLNKIFTRKLSYCIVKKVN